MIEFAHIAKLQEEENGFCFNLSRHESELRQIGVTGGVESYTVKTGTTICACACEEGIVLAADTRATSGQCVSQKDCLKLHPLAPNIFCAGAGTAADLMHLTMQIRADLAVFAYTLGRAVSVETVATRVCNLMSRYGGHLGLHLIIGGVNPDGKSRLCRVDNRGYCVYAAFHTMGSGGMFAKGIFELGYKPGLSLDEARQLCCDAIQAGLLNDDGSGTQVDSVTIPRSDPQNPILTRGIRKPLEGKINPVSPPVFKTGTTLILSETRRPHQQTA